MSRKRGVSYRKRNKITNEEKRYRKKLVIQLWLEISQCCYCGKKLPLKQATLEHFIPVSQNGRTTYTNCAVACHTCNGWRSSIPVNEFMSCEKLQQRRIKILTS
jgi:5-methylcytosine-specific restriction endonuclease McrA